MPLRARSLAAFFCLAGAMATLAGCGDRAHRSPIDELPSRSALAGKLGIARPGGGRWCGVAWSKAAQPASAPTPRTSRTARLRDLPRPLLTFAAAPSAELDGERALVALAAGRSDAAMALLNAAAGLVPRSGWPPSDLAVVHLARAGPDDEALELVASLIASQRALSREPGLPAARFNQAVALERLNLRQAAADAWQEVLAGEPHPQWAAEEREHLAALTRQLPAADWPAAGASLEQAAATGDQRTVDATVARWPQQVRELGEEDILAAWAEALAGGQTQAADRFLAIGRQLGAALARGSGEQMLQDAVAVIDGAARPPTARAALAALATGHRAYGAALLRLSRDDLEAARQALVQARASLARAGSPLLAWADFQLALCAFRQSDFRRAVPLLRAVPASPRSQRYPALRGRALWLLGLIDGIQGRLTPSLTEKRQALAIFHNLREVANEARLEAMIAGTLNQLDASAEAWHVAGAALRDAARCDVPLAAFAADEEVAEMARDLHQPALAGFFQDEVVRSAWRIGRPAVVAEALRGRARIFAAAGRADLARGDLEQAGAQLAAVRDRRGRAGVQGDLLLVAGAVGRPRDAAGAVVPLTRALAFFREAGDHAQLVDALAERALASQTLGDGAGAAADLRAALAEIERQRGRIAGTEERIGFLDQEKAVFDRMVALQLRQNHRDLAFDYGERERARALLDWIVTSPPGSTPRSPRRGAPPLTAAAIRSRLAPGTTLLVFAEVPPRLVAWVVRRHELSLIDTGITAAAAATATRQLQTALLEHRQAELLDAESRLYESLILPAAASLPAGGPLVVIPQGTLAALPFALLRDARTGRYLAEEYTLSTAPSATLYLQSVARDRQLGALPDGGAVFIGDPAFDREASADLPGLPAAAAEARDLAAACAGATAATLPCGRLPSYPAKPDDGAPASGSPAARPLAAGVDSSNQV